MQPVRTKGRGFFGTHCPCNPDDHQALHACPNNGPRDDRDGGVCVRFAARRFIEVGILEGWLFVALIVELWQTMIATFTFSVY